MLDSAPTYSATSSFNSVAARIKSVRMQLGLSRKGFEKQTGISANTLQSWESGKNQLTNKGANKLFLALKKLGLNCSVEWLLYGEGLTPRINASEAESWQEDERILKEVMFFESNNPSSIVYLVRDDSMQPYYELGDYVAGSVRSSSQAEKLIGSNCIVTLDSGITLLRRLSQDNQERFNLYSTNLETKVENAFVMDCHIQRIAQVIWHRSCSRCPF